MTDQATVAMAAPLLVLLTDEWEEQNGQQFLKALLSTPQLADVSAEPVQDMLQEFVACFLLQDLEEKAGYHSDVQDLRNVCAQYCNAYGLIYTEDEVDNFSEFLDAYLPQ